VSVADPISEFLIELVDQLGPTSCLNIGFSEFKLFGTEEKPIQSVEGSNWESLLVEDKNYDLIFADLSLGVNKSDLPSDLNQSDFPIGLRNSDFIINGKILKNRGGWKEIYKALRFLTEKGVGVFLLEPSAFDWKDGKIFEDFLNSKGFYVGAFFEVPNYVLMPFKHFVPLIALISRIPNDEIFVAELQNKDQMKAAIIHYFNGGELENLRSGMKIPNTIFRGFGNLRIRHQIFKLETEFKSFNAHSMKDLSKNVIRVNVGQQLKEIENSIYIPAFGSSPVLSSLNNTELKHCDYYQVVLHSNVSNKYIEAFFKSALGTLILSSMKSVSYIKHITKRELLNISIPLPSNTDQHQIIRTQKKLHELRDAISEFETELSLNPVSSNAISEQLDGMLESINGLTEIDKIQNILRQGESKTVEFKETLSIDVKKNTKQKYIELAILKTIVAFLNTEGGNLLIGVNDSAIITGVNFEITQEFKNRDKYLLHFSNLIKVKIGEGFYPFLNYDLVEINEKIILKVECTKSNSPCYLEGKDFYVRTNPATNKLEGPKLVEYVTAHFE
jgi:hypothetical protein